MPARRWAELERLSTARVDLYVASVPVFLRYLERLGGLVAAAQACPLEERTVLQARLAPDMLAFEAQVRVAANFALRACFPLAGLAVPPLAPAAASFEDLRNWIAEVSTRLESLPRTSFEAAQSRVIEDRAGQALVSLPGAIFLWQYALPNFFFHLTSAYAILRHCGVPVGKADFDGWHVYDVTR